MFRMKNLAASAASISLIQGLRGLLSMLQINDGCRNCDIWLDGDDDPAARCPRCRIAYPRLLACEGRWTTVATFALLGVAALVTAFGIRVGAAALGFPSWLSGVLYLAAGPARING